VQRGLRMDCIDEEFMKLSQRVVGFILDAKQKFNRVIVAFPNSSLQDIARLEPDRMAPSHQTSLATTSLRAKTHV
nr:hypothetical protein [Tanacetum cinerariifolium]